jgi:acetylornithine deacetylase/succinyl-diaminopimelate desuccinylase-like protein
LIVDHLMDLIRIPSVSTMSNRPVIEYASTILQSAGWTTREVVYRDAAGIEKVNLIAAPAGQDVDAREVELAFVCHTDTVPYSVGWGGSTSPYVENGMVHGCGACDVKGSLTCLLAAAECCRGRCIDGLRIVLTADEEIGCVGAIRGCGQHYVVVVRLGDLGAVEGAGDEGFVGAEVVDEDFAVDLGGVESRCGLARGVRSLRIRLRRGGRSRGLPMRLWIWC